MRLKSRKIVVVGSINTDLVVNADRLPQVGETVSGSGFATFQGGKGANQAVAAARLGAEVAMIGMVGADDFGSASLRALRGEGVDCEHVGVANGSSGVALISVGGGGANTIVVVPGANAQITPELLERKREVISGAGIVLAQLEIPLETVAHLGRLCEKFGVPLMLDPAPAQTLPEEVLRSATWFTPNETEAAFFAGEAGSATAEETVRRLRGQGAGNLVLKRGAEGAYIDRVGEQPFAVPAFPVVAVDSTAAGDTYNGAFAAALAEGKPLPACARFAAAAAAISVTRAGAQASMPRLDEVQAWFAHRG